MKQKPEIEQYFKSCSNPDESFFQTLILETISEDYILDSNLAYTDWSNLGNSPRILTNVDYDDIAKTNKLFARKFDETVDPNILGMIDEKL